MDRFKLFGITAFFRDVKRIMPLKVVAELLDGGLIAEIQPLLKQQHAQHGMQLFGRSAQSVGKKWRQLPNGQFI